MAPISISTMIPKLGGPKKVLAIVTLFKKKNHLYLDREDLNDKTKRAAKLKIVDQLQLEILI